MFLGVKAEVENFKSDEMKYCSFDLCFSENPLTDFVELPEHL